ncbi:hypothetical protein [Cohnella sp. AR92]|uniref:hypothetical protein n=1 Tax=Cohnella sp. AR92 TaxID=648716 RepID=UPI000F8D8A88|nr:hypothetical protein [Cohnella sp. AR92]RUS45577.1 hypothetical protein ELR57_19720 [Cohnella sp. AR92]
MEERLIGSAVLSFLVQLEILEKDSEMLFIVIVIIIGYAGLIGNQYSSLKRMDGLQKSLDEINQSLREIKETNRRTEN